jgi:flagellar hook protein FlgE
MNRSLYTGISGLLGHQQKLDVVGNNIANASTAGFKRSRINFQDAFSQTLRYASEPTGTASGKVPMQVGLGTKVASIDRIYEQGNLELTGTTTDLAIYGDGFFAVRDGSGTSYTRNGAFQINPMGALVTADGQAVLGLNADATGTLPSVTDMGAIVLPLSEASPAVATTSVVLSQNLNAEMTESTAGLVSLSNTAGVTGVSGTAVNGLGGTWNVTVTGAGATQSTFTGANVAQPGALTGSMTLGDLGVTTFGSLSLSVDGGTPVEVTGFDAETTLSEFMALVESRVGGVDLSLQDGELVLSRTRFGTGTDNNVALSETGGDALTQLFGSAAISATNGTDSTLAATGVFTTTRGVVMDQVPIALGEVDPLDGQVTDVLDLGGGGVSVLAANGLTAGTFQVSTADSVHETSIVVYDSLGASHTMSVSFTRGEEPNMWYWEATVPPPAGTISGNTGVVRFSEQDGSLGSFTYDNGAAGLSFDPGNGALVQITLDAGTVGALDGLTQTAYTTTSLALSQNGRAMGELESVDFLDDGKIQGVYSNGETRTLAQVLVAEFTNTSGLSANGGSNFVQTGASGTPRLGLAGSELSSVIKSGYLEMSNTDLSKELTEMILAQRGFQAAARVISTADTILGEVIQLKR